MDHNNLKKKYLNQLINQILDYIIENINNKEIQLKIQQKILDPMIDYIGRRLYPYILMISFCFVLLILLLFFMIWNK